MQCIGLRKQQSSAWEATGDQDTVGGNGQLEHVMREAQCSLCKRLVKTWDGLREACRCVKHIVLKQMGGYDTSSLGKQLEITKRVWHFILDFVSVLAWFEANGSDTMKAHHLR